MDWKKQTISLMLAGCMTASVLPAAFAVEAQAETPVPVSEAVTAQPEVTAPKAAHEPENAPVSVQAAQPDSPAEAQMQAGTPVARGTCGKNVTWTLDAKGVLTISGTGKMEVEPDEYSPVEWSDYADQIKSVVIKPGVTSIVNSAFSVCVNLTSVTIPNSVTSIGDSAFSTCEKLKSITIPNSVTSIGTYAFTGCSSLASLNIPNGVTTIGDCVFWDCKSLTGITIPSSVTSIGVHLFSGCTNMQSVAVDPQNRFYCSENGILFNKKKTELIYYPGNKAGAYTIPNSVKTVRDEAFQGCSKLTSITVPDSVTSLGESAFWGCTKLKSAKLGTGITEVKDHTFYSCETLEGVSIPKGVTSIGESAFSFCGKLKNITLPDALTTIGVSAFESCGSLTSVTIPKSVKSIYPFAFSGCDGIKTIYFCGDVPEIPEDESDEGYSDSERGSFAASGEGSGAPFDGVTATGFYPQGNRTWTESARERFGGDITWKTWIPGSAKKPVSQIFSDVPANAWYVNAVQYAYDNNIMAGTGGKFMPNGTMTRAMVVQTLYNISGKPAVSGKPGFSDIKTTDWYCKAVLWAEQNKVAAGSNGKFNPNGLVTREQFAQFLYNYAGSPKVSGALRGFADTASVSGWAKKALTWANQKGVVSGKPSGGKLYLDPKGKATRAEAAAMLMKYKTM